MTEATRFSLFGLAFNTGVRRKPGGWIGRLINVYAAAAAVWIVYAAAYSRTDVLSLTITFLALMLVLSFLLIGPNANSDPQRIGWYDWPLALLSAIAGIYFSLQSDTINQRITLLDPLSTMDIAFATIMILLTLETMRRTVGMGLTIIVLIFIVYNLFGSAFTGPLSHGEISYVHFLDVMMFTTDGLFGVPLRVAATYAFLFVLFGTALEKSGGGEFFFNIAAVVSGRAIGGPAKIAVISSGLYGTVSGSPTSDVVTTGAVTIPIMKRLGYSSSFAGAVEVAASTGGSLLPPVMGAAAFIMAEYTGIDYIDIAIAAIIPAILYYVPIYYQVHLRATKLGFSGLSKDEVPRLMTTLKEGVLFIIPLGVIVWTLLKGYTPTYAGLYGTYAVVAVAMLKASTRLSPKDLFDILATASLRTVAVTGACAAAGMVIGGVTMTGLASKFSHLVFLLTDADVFLSLIMAAALTIILGLGMPTPSAYILAAVLISPVIATLNIDLLASHLFLLNFAVMSSLTPPVAVAAYAASAIADENPLKIAAAAMRLALAAFLLPFSFVYHPALLMNGSVIEIILSTLSAGIGLLLVAMAIEGFFHSSLNVLTRCLLAAAGILFLFIDLWYIAAAVVLIALAAGAQRLMPDAAAAKGSSS